MCYVDGSIDHVTSSCPMCKIFRPAANRCPHRTETCRNRIAHPLHDVVHFVNAEVRTFNGCGFCKWAQLNPPPNKAGPFNYGWPGCCRAPLPNEHEVIPAADWYAVSVVHKVPIPPEVKLVLERLRQSNGTVGRKSPISRTSLAAAGRSPSAGIIQKLKSTDGSKQSASTGSASAICESSTKPDVVLLSPSKVVRRLSAGEADLTANPAVAKAPLSKASPPTSPQSGSKTLGRSFRRRSLQTGAMLNAPATMPASSTPKVRPSVLPKSQSKVDLDDESNDAKSVASVASSSSSEGSLGGLSSGSSAAASGTVTSEGGFTDYLSDESEAELQRQAEVRAAQLEQNRMEEQEFKAARQQLASVDLQPPRSWNPGTPNDPSATLLHPII